MYGISYCLKSILCDAIICYIPSISKKRPIPEDMS